MSASASVSVGRAELQLSLVRVADLKGFAVSIFYSSAFAAFHFSLSTSRLISDSGDVRPVLRSFSEGG